MHRVRAYLPSANYLFTFEAAARRGSFTAAAAELNVSQPAVSKTIRQFEAALGFKLFHRNHTRLELTPEGKRLYHETESAFDALHAAITSMRRTDRHEVVRATFSASFLQLWLLPRLSEFSELHPEIRLSLEESTYDDMDLFTNGIDLSARLGDGGWNDLHAWPLTPELIFPVAAPSYIERHCADLAVCDMQVLKLIHVREKNRVRCGWHEWLAANRLPCDMVSETFVFSDALNSIGAAALGQGVALGWVHLVMDQIQSGALRRVSDLGYCTGKSIHLIAPGRKPLSSATQKFVTWILDRMQRDIAGNRTCFDPGPRPA